MENVLLHFPVLVRLKKGDYGYKLGELDAWNNAQESREMLYGSPYSSRSTESCSACALQIERI
jgi:hypothetical protein